ncbi:MAG: hypothetical protein QGI49_05155, partial [SAR202 cluster bacterium]|nr:hypothetical protein [SAR202 cluster bacterium]
MDSRLTTRFMEICHANVPDEEDKRVLVEALAPLRVTIDEVAEMVHDKNPMDYFSVVARLH